MKRCHVCGRFCSDKKALEFGMEFGVPVCSLKCGHKMLDRVDTFMEAK